MELNIKQQQSESRTYIMRNSSDNTLLAYISTQSQLRAERWMWGWSKKDYIGQ